MPAIPVLCHSIKKSDAGEELIKMRIAMPRGDIRLVRFLINDIGSVATDIDFSEMYFTVKKTTKDRAFLFQKKLSNEEILKLGPGDYQIRIEPEDTNNLTYGNYKFDVQLTWIDERGEQQLKETFVGDFVITEEVTYVTNE